MLSAQKSWLSRLPIRYGFAVGMAVTGFLLRQALTALGATGLPTYITFYPAIMLTAMAAGLWPGIVATVAVALITDYWILPPEGFGISSFTDVVGVVFFSGMGVFMSLVAEFYRRAREKAQKSSLELKAANETLRDLSSKIFSAHEDERKRIASDIHDTLGSSLAAIKFKMDHAQAQEEETTNAATECLNTVMPLVQDCIQECRRIQMDLRPSMIDDLGLLATLSWFCRRYETVYPHIRTEQTIRIDESEIPSALKVPIYRVTQEAMNNIAKHSKADLIRLSLEKMDTRMEVTIQDNGRGFNPEKVNSRGSLREGMGLSSMRERTELAGGSFGIESREGQGTIIHMSWPLGKDAYLTQLAR